MPILQQSLTRAKSFIRRHPEWLVLLFCLGIVAALLLAAAVSALLPGWGTKVLFVIPGALTVLLLVMILRRPWLIAGIRSRSNDDPLLRSYSKRYAGDRLNRLSSFLIKSGNERGSEILIHAGSRGRLDKARVDELLDALIAGTGPKNTQLLWLRPSAAALYAKLLFMQGRSRQTLLRSVALYEFLRSRYGLHSLRRSDQRIMVEALLSVQLPEQAHAIAHTWQTDRNDVERRLLADTINPFYPGSTEDHGPWLSLVNEEFLRYGLEPLALEEDDSTPPYDRLRSEPAAFIDSEQRVTVVVSAYRPDSRLLTSLRSVLASSWRNIELLLIDDASGPEYTEQYEQARSLDHRIVFHQMERNGGTYAIRNHALTVATGDFITFHDSDDWMHPRRLELQVKQLLENPGDLANITNSVRVTDALQFSHSRGAETRICEVSIMMRHPQARQALGFYDLVRRGGDSEYRLRLEAYTGAKTPLAHEAPLILPRVDSESLSGGDLRRGWQHSSRRVYRACYKQAHKTLLASGLPLALPRPESTKGRSCYAPAHILGTTQRAHFDVIVASHWRESGSKGGTQRSGEEEIKALSAHGAKVGIMNLDSLWLSAVPGTELNPRIARMLNEGLAEWVNPDDAVATDVLIIRYPAVLEFQDPIRSGIDAEHIIIEANQTPAAPDGSARRYSVETVDANCEALFGALPLWIPQGPQTRAALHELVPEERLVPYDNVPLLDVAQWRVQRQPLTARTPVIGRYSRDALEKWPASKTVIESIYRIQGFRTRIMGGDRAIAKYFGGTAPSGWEVLPEGAEEPRRFLSEIDFFVYYHHPNLTESFGRSLIEAMASAAVVVLPPHFEPTFGEAAVYAEPEQVATVIRDLSADSSRYASQQQKALEYLERTVSYDSYTDLIATLTKAKVALRSPRV